MKMETITFRLVGVRPLIMHNGQLANPLNPAAKAIKEVSSKRVKTDADHEEMARREYLGSLYLTVAPGTDNELVPCIPDYVLEASIVEGAKVAKLGKQAKASIEVSEDAILEYLGPKDAHELSRNEKFIHSALVRVGQARVCRTRPVFPEWSAVATVSFDPEGMNRAQVEAAIVAAGKKGVGDWRPKHGRFEVEFE